MTRLPPAGAWNFGAEMQRIWSRHVFMAAHFVTALVVVGRPTGGASLLLSGRSGIALPQYASFGFGFEYWFGCILFGN